jgi:tetratricopeptide (TPR) repeat protein
MRFEDDSPAIGGAEEGGGLALRGVNDGRSVASGRAEEGGELAVRGAREASSFVSHRAEEARFLRARAALMLGGSVDCLDDTLVLALVSGQLGEGDLARVDAHLDTCGECRALVVTVARGASGGADGDADAADLGALRPGARVGRYLVDGVVGDGAMGIVLAARDPDLDRRVALKLLRAEASLDASAARDRLLREAQAMARLQHPNVVAVFDVGTFGERVFLAMELVEGATLRAWMSEPRSWTEVCDVMEQAGRGLAAAHAAGLVHRDVKPDNIMVGRDGRARIGDFGLACAGDEGIDREMPLDPLLSRTGTLPGTPAYMAPEALRGESADARSDQFSFCATFFEALHGQRPFSGASIAELRAAIEEGRVAAVRANGGKPRGAGGSLGAMVSGRSEAGRAAAPAWLDATVKRGLAARPEERFPSMAALLDAISARRGRSGGRRLWAGAIGAGLVAAAAFALLLRPGARAPSCDGGAARVATVWNDAARARVTAALSAGGDASSEGSRSGDVHRGGDTGGDASSEGNRSGDVHRGGDTGAAESGSGRHGGDASGDAAKVVTALDRWATGWAAAHDETCRATHVRGDQSALLLDLRMRCLERRRAEAGVLVERLGRGEGQDARRALDAVMALPEADECRDLDATGTDPLPHDPALADAAERALSGLADARAALLVGDHRRALALANELSGLAARSGHAPTQAEVDLVRAEALRLGGDGRGAEDAAQSSLSAAERGHDDVAAARAWLLLIALAGERRDLAAAEERARHAEAALARAGNPRALVARLDHARGLVAESLGRLDDAERYLTAALELRRSLHGDDDLEVARSLAALGGVARARGRLDDARRQIEAALAIDERRLGESHPDVARDLHNLGGVERLAGDLDTALRHYTRALAIRRAALGEEHVDTALTHNSIGLVWMARARFAEAEQEFTAALAVLRRAHHGDRAIAQHNLALVAQQRGDHATALRLFAEAEAVYRDTVGETSEAMKKLQEDRAASERALAGPSAKTPSARGPLAGGSSAGIVSPAVRPPRVPATSTAPASTAPRVDGMYGAPRPWDRN